MTRDNEEPITAIDAIRCIWLARTATARGDHETARRWQAKADAWLLRQPAAAQPDTFSAADQLAPAPPTDFPTTHTT